MDRDGPSEFLKNNHDPYTDAQAEVDKVLGQAPYRGEPRGTANPRDVAQFSTDPSLWFGDGFRVGEEDWVVTSRSMSILSRASSWQRNGRRPAR